MKRITIVGATSAIAEHCARLWLAQGPASLQLVVRDAARAQRLLADLRVRSPESTIDLIEGEFAEPARIAVWVSELVAQGSPDIVLIAHGTLPDQKQCEADLEAANAAMTINGLSPVLFAEAFANAMSRSGSGTVCIIGSVAGDRGRKTNYVYGAAKGLVTRYAQGLQHRFAGTGVSVVLVKPGPTDTPMTAELKATGARLAPVEDVAAAIVRGVERKQAVVYAPAKWWLIMMVVRHLPAVIFNKLNI